MINPLEQYRVMRGSGLTPVGAVFFVALMVVTSPLVALATWATPHQKGFGKFRARERVFDLRNLEESTHVLDGGDRRYFIQPNDTPAEAWWHEEIRMLRMLESQTMHAEAVARLRREQLQHFPTLADIEAAHKSNPEVFGPVPPFSRLSGTADIRAVIGGATGRAI